MISENYLSNCIIYLVIRKWGTVQNSPKVGQKYFNEKDNSNR